MKNAKWWMGLLAVLGLASGFPLPSARGATATVDGIQWTYTVSDGKATVGGEPYSNITAVPATTSGAITIPSTLGGYPVTGIGDYAFWWCWSLTNVTIPNSVTSIGAEAFYGCPGLMSVTIPSGVTSIGYAAFSGCSSLTSVTIPASVTNVGDGIFSGCSSLTSISVGTGNPAYASKGGVLFTKDGKTLLFCPEGKTGSYSVPSGVTSIGDGAFCGCYGLTSVTLPDGVTNIGYEVFSGCSGLTSVTIPASATNLNPFAFRGCSGLASIAVSSGNPVYAAQKGVLFTKDGKMLLYCPEGKTGSYAVPNGVVQIGKTELVTTSYVIGESGWLGFNGCSNLTAVTLPSGVTNIVAEAFYGCTNLTSVNIPDSVTRIGYAAFGWCHGDWDWGNGECGDIYDTKTLPGVRLVDGWVVGWTGSLSGALDLTGVRGIAGSAFSGCSSLKSVTIPASVTSIGDGAFIYCSGLASIAVAAGNPAYAGQNGVLFTKDGKTLLCCPGGKTGTYSVPSGVESIGNEAFFCCAGLTNVTISAGVTDIGYYAFSGCSGLKSLTIPNGVTRIGALAFNECYGLSSLVLPDSLRSIPHGAFWDCGSLKSLKFGNSVTNIGGCAFENCMSLATITIPGHVKSIDGGAFLSCTGLTSVVISEGVASIGEYAFEDCSGLKSVTLSDSVTSIGEGAFHRCSSLASLTIPAGVTSLGIKAFDGCTALKTLYVPASWKGASMLDAAGIPSGCKVVYASLTLGASERTFTADAASGKLLEVTAHVSWTAKSSASWLTVKTASGSGNGNIEYAVAANTGTGSRTGTITVSGGGLTRTFTVTQSGKTVTLVLGASERTFTADAATSKELGVTANVSWTAISSASWLILKTASGSGSGTIVYNVAANTGTTRTGTITVTGGGLTRTFTVTQSGKEITWSYTVDGGRATVTGGTPAEGEFSIPSSLGGYPVTDIGECAFAEYANLTSVTIPVSVTNIGRWAFTYCSGLTNVVIPEGVAIIGYEAFLGCSSLTSLAIPASVTYIDTEPFSECNSLKSFQVAAGNPSYKSVDGVLFTKDGKKLVCCPGGKTGSYVIPNSVTNIEWFAFSWCTGLTSVTIPDSVTYIGFHAFQFCDGLKTLTLPDSVTYLEYSALLGLDFLETLYVPASWEGTSKLEYAGVSENCTVVYGGAVLTLDEDSRTFAAAGEDGKQLLVTANVSWTAKSSATWLTVKTTSGSGNGNIEYAVAANTGTNSRTGTITVSGGGLTRTFTVTQSGKTLTLELGASERSFTASAASGKELSVTANVSWTAKSSASWLTVKTGSGTGNGTIVYDVAANTGAGSRTGTITVSGSGLTRTFTVTQSGKTVTLELGSSERTFTADAASGKLLSVTANVSWTAKSSASWLTVKTTSGSGSGNIEYAVAANAGGTRTATITVSGGGVSRTFTVTQSGKVVTLTLGASEGSFTANGAGGQVLGVTADVSWTAQSSVSWLTVKTASGTGNGTIVYDIAANTVTEARTGTITVSGGGVVRTFTATQSGAEAKLELGTSGRSFTADAAGGMELSVTANVTWMAKSSATWLMVKTGSGTGNGSIAYDVAANAGTESRTGRITVSGGGVTRTFTATQSGAEAKLELGASERSFTPDAAGGLELSVTANVSWTAKSSASWLTVKTASGTGNGVLVYDVAVNTGTGERTGVVTVTGGGLTRVFVVTQGGKTETQESPVGVPCQWLEANVPGILAKNGGDYEAAAKATAANGRTVWECYVAGVSATNAAENFTAVLTSENGRWVVKPEPDLGDAREYIVEGASEIGEAAVWGPVTEKSRFLRVWVGLKRDK